MESVQQKIVGILMLFPETRPEFVELTKNRWEELITSASCAKAVRWLLNKDGHVTPDELSVAVDMPVDVIAKWYDGVGWDEKLALRETYVPHLLNQYKLQRLQQILDAYQRPSLGDVNQVVELLAKQLTDIANDCTDVYNPSVTTAAKKFRQHRADLLMHPTLVPCGLPPIDDEMGGFPIPNDQGVGASFIGLLGPEKAGKSRLARHILGNICGRQRVPSAWVSVESEESIDKVIALMIGWEAARRLVEMSPLTGRELEHFTTEYSFDYIYHRQWDGGPQSSILESAIDDVEQWPLRIYSSRLTEGNSSDINAIVSRIRADVQLHGVRFIVWDNAHSYKAGGENDYQTMNRVIPPIKNIVSQLGATVLLLCQKNKEGETKGRGVIEPEVSVLFRIESSPTDAGFSSRYIDFSSRLARYFGRINYQFFVEPNSGYVLGGQPL